MIKFIRAFIITLLITLIPLATFSAIVYTDEVTRRIGYDDLSPTVEISDSSISAFGNTYPITTEGEKIKQAQSFLTPPVIKLQSLIIRKTVDLIVGPEE